MSNKKVYTEEEQFSPDFIEKFASIKSKNPINNSFSSLADVMIEKRSSNKKRSSKDSVIVDHLSFSFPLMSLRHCHKAGFAGFTPSTQPYFSLPPKIENSEGKTQLEIDNHAIYLKDLLQDFYVRSLKEFVSHVLGFEVSAPRDKGFHGYINSLTMKTKSGVEVGFIGIGGQNDTVFIQISGTGCKHLFEHTTKFTLHHWLNSVLHINFLSRIDLAKDDYDDNFNCDYAVKAYLDGAFRSGKGGRMAVFKDASEYIYKPDLSKEFDVEMICVGKRTSPIYWRVYNKKLEQKIVSPDFSWYRSEAELKKWTVDCLLDVDATFCGLNEFSKSMSSVEGVRTKSMTKAKEVCLDLAASVRWVRHAAGRALGDILKIVDGDISKAIGLLLPDVELGAKLGIPPTYNKIINHVLET